MPSYYVDTGCDNQIRVEARDQEDAVIEFMRRARWSLDKQTEQPYVDWSAVSFYVSPPFELCSWEDCEEETMDDASSFCDEHEVESHLEHCSHGDACPFLEEGQ